MPKRRRYGPEHTHTRAYLLKRYRPGRTLCIRCGRPIRETDTSRIHLGHPDAGNGMNYGLEHHSCNEAAGGVASGLSRRGGKPKPVKASEQPLFPEAGPKW